MKDPTKDYRDMSGVKVSLKSKIIIACIMVLILIWLVYGLRQAKKEGIILEKPAIEHKHF